MSQHYIAIFWDLRHCPTDKRHDKNAEKDPENVAEDVHEDDGDEGDGEVELALPLLAAPAAEDLPNRGDWIEIVTRVIIFHQQVGGTGNYPENLVRTNDS